VVRGFGLLVFLFVRVKVKVDGCFGFGVLVVWGERIWFMN